MTYKGKIQKFGKMAVLVLAVAITSTMAGRAETAGAAKTITKLKKVDPGSKKVTLKLKKERTFTVMISPGGLSKKARKLRLKTDKKGFLKLGNIKYKKKKGKCYATFTVKARKAGCVKLTLSPGNKSIRKKLTWTILISKGKTNRDEKKDTNQEAEQDVGKDSGQEMTKIPTEDSDRKTPENQTEVSGQETQDPLTEESDSEKQEKEDFFQEQNKRAQDLLCEFVNIQDNAMVSGYSLRTALSMLASGASGETRSELEDYFGSSVEELEKFGAKACAMYNKEGLYSANSAWVDESAALNSDYQGKLEQAYGAEVQKLDFSDTEKSAEAINDWCSRCTKQMIPKLVSPPLLEGQRMVLANALYFEQRWIDPFFEQNTQKKDFCTGLAQKVKVDMMAGSGDRYIESADSEGFTKNYENGYYFAAICAKKAGAAVSTEDIRQLGTLAKNANKDYIVRIEMPRVKFDGDYQLKDYLAKSGIKKAFTGAAEFGGMMSSGESLQVSEVIQKTAVEITEEGTKAAAATAAIVKNGCMPVVRQEKKIVLDQPYAFGIFDSSTGEMLFSGYVNNPE